MKFTDNHYEALKSAIASKQIDLLKAKKEYEENGLSNQRYLWDIFWFSGYSTNASFREASYKDTHIETAVKKAVLELTNQNKQL